MSVQTEIARIAQAKTDIKNVVNSKVANTITNQTIDAFPPLIDSSIAAYKNLIPWIEGSGSSFAIDNAESGKLDKFEIYGNTHQDSYTGKNLLKNTGTSTTKNGLTYIVNSDGTFTINGTATSTTYYEITNSFTFDDGVTYMMSGCPSDGASSSYYIIHNASPWNTDYGRGALVNGTGKTVSIQAVVVSGTTCNNLLFKPQIELGSTKTSFEPYTNGASPNPDYPQDVRVVTGNNSVKVVGKNLFDKSKASIGYRVGSDGTLYADANYFVTDYINVIPSTTYSGNTSFANLYNRIAYYNKNKTLLSMNDGGDLKYFTTPNNCVYVRFGKYINQLDTFILVIGNEAPTSYEPYQRQTYPINLGNMELCKIGSYQDYIYKENGKWYKHSEIGKVVLDGSEDFDLNTSYTNTSRIAYFNFLPNQGLADYTTGKCSHLNGKMMWKTDEEGFYININALVLRFNKSTVGTTKADVQAWLSNNNVTVYYTLATPTNTEITDTTLISQLNAIETYTGTNIFSVSNSNGVLPDLYILTEKQNSYKN